MARQMQILRVEDEKEDESSNMGDFANLIDPAKNALDDSPLAANMFRCTALGTDSLSVAINAFPCTQPEPNQSLQHSRI